MKIKISGVIYDIVYKTNEEMNGLIGTADFNRQLISINETHTKQTQKIALVHEILHLIDETYGTGLTEQQIKILTHGIIAFSEENEILDIRSTTT